jgi:hypothetical protein
MPRLSSNPTGGGTAIRRSGPGEGSGLPARPPSGRGARRPCGRSAASRRARGAASRRARRCLRSCHLQRALLTASRSSCSEPPRVVGSGRRCPRWSLPHHRWVPSRPNRPAPPLLYGEKAVAGGHTRDFVDILLSLQFIMSICVQFMSICVCRFASPWLCRR